MQLDLKIKIIGFFYCFALTDMFSLILLKKIIMHFNCGYIKFAGVKKKISAHIILLFETIRLWGHPLVWGCHWCLIVAA